MDLVKSYRKYKWFFTSSGKLVVGGKSAEQNDALLKEITKNHKDHIVMHTSSPGSPFSVILSDMSKITKKDLEECASFTGCFSRAWKQRERKVEVHIFKSSELHKERSMKTGTWGVKGKVNKIKVKLELVLIKQKGTLRAVPEKSIKKKDILLKVCPGSVDKSSMFNPIASKIKEKFGKEDFMSALPAGGIKICR